MTKQLGLSAPSTPLVVENAPDPGALEDLGDLDSYVRLIPSFRPNSPIEYVDPDTGAQNVLEFDKNDRELLQGRVFDSSDRHLTFWSKIQKSGYLPSRLSVNELRNHRERFTTVAPQAIYQDQTVRWLLDTPEHMLVAWQAIEPDGSLGGLFVSEAPYQYLIYGRNDDSDFKFFGGILAQAFRPNFWQLLHFDDKTQGVNSLEEEKDDSGNLVPRFSRFFRLGGVPLPESQVPDYIPYVVSNEPRNNYLRTRILSADNTGTVVTLEDVPQVTSAFVAHDNSLLLQSALGDPFDPSAQPKRVEIPAATDSYPVFANLYLRTPIELEGEAQFLGRRAPRSTLQFQPGFGCESLARSSIIRNIGFEGVSNQQLSLPAGGVFVRNLVTPSRPRPDPPSGFTQHHYRIILLANQGDALGRFEIELYTSPEILTEVTHGCGVLIQNARTSWINCRFGGFAGTGHAIWGYPNGNHTRVDECESSKNSGHGFFAGGSGNTNDCSWHRCDVVGNRGWGIYDSGQLGNHLLGCHAVSNGEGPYIVEDSSAFSTIIGCYSEGSKIYRPSKANQFTVVVGGVHGAGFSNDTTALLLLNRKSISPLEIKRVVQAGRFPYDELLETDDQTIKLGQHGPPKRNLLSLFHFLSQREFDAGRNG